MVPHAQPSKGRVLILSAPSGGGKTTFFKKIKQDFPAFVPSISLTTRPPRINEREGSDYFFVHEAEFQSKIQKGDFIEWAKVHGNYYGTSKTVVDQALQAGQSVLLDIDVQGADQLKKKYGDQALTFFILPPSLKELEKRLKLRGKDSEEIIQNRLKNATLEIKESPKFDYRIVNDSIDRAYAELKAILQNQYDSL